MGSIRIGFLVLAAAAAACSDNATGPSANRDAVVDITVGTARNAVLVQDGQHPIPVTVTFSRVAGATTYVSLRVCLSQSADPGGGALVSPLCAGMTRAQSPVSFELNSRPTTWAGPGAPPTITYQYIHAILYSGDVLFSPLGDIFIPYPPVHTKTLEWPISVVPLPRP